MMCVAASLYLFTIIEKLAGNVKQFIRAVSDIVTVRCCSLVVRVVKYMRQNACTLAFCVQMGCCLRLHYIKLCQN